MSTEGVNFLLSLDQETVDMHGSEVLMVDISSVIAKVNPDFSEFGRYKKINWFIFAYPETTMKQGSLMQYHVTLGMSGSAWPNDTKMFKDAITEKLKNPKILIKTWLLSMMVL